MSALARRAFLGRLGGALLAPTVSARIRPEQGVAAAGTAPDDWGRIQDAFDLDRSATYLNCASIGSAPRSVQRAVATDAEFANRLPSRHTWSVLEPGQERVRSDLARALGATPEEIALTRNATEALELVQMGLELQRGDEVLTTDQDFFRMLYAWKQRERRDGIVLRTISPPARVTDPGELLHIFSRALTDRTRILLFCHVNNLSGQIYPAREICELARQRGVQTLVDGAQAFAHVPVDVTELGCDYYGGSLHKYALAPLGTGFLYVRQDRIQSLWPLLASDPDRAADIRKLEEIGTHPAAGHNAVAEALRFRSALGPDRIAARLRELTVRWTDVLADRPGVRFCAEPGPPHTAAIATVGLEGWPPRELADRLWEDARIVVRPIQHAAVQGVRISPHVYNTTDEIDLLTHTLEHLLEERRPA
ncbi:MAG: aminotransferase class V-fold PLP-dependent enzyme [Gemmatimonadota bacterium]